MVALRLLLLILVELPVGQDAIYLPGVAPTEFEDGAKVEVRVNSLTSVKTQLPYGYYRLPYCKPLKVQQRAENLGEILTGDEIENSPYEVNMLVNASCKSLCKVTLDEQQKELFRLMIDDEYLVNFIVDNLPGAVRLATTRGDMYLSGFPVGSQRAGRYYVHNHITFHLNYHNSPETIGAHRIVGVEIEPRSLTQMSRSDPTQTGGFVAKCGASEALPIFDLDVHDEIIFTYDVLWTESSIRWASRWDLYLKMQSGKVHWFSIMNSLLIIILLSAMVAMILLRTLHADIAMYNAVLADEDAQEETGWKLVHGDVFRRPKFSMLLAASIGAGVQIFGMVVVVLIFALLGFLSPAHRGGLLQTVILLFACMGLVSGYISSRLYKTMSGERTRLTILMTACLYPGVFFALCFLLNLLVWSKKSSGAVPFPIMFALLVLWFGFSVPLVMFGSYSALKQPAIELPVRTNTIPRQIPEQPAWNHPVLTAMVGGVLPFGAVFTELFFIMSSLWQHQFYYLFGFLALVLLLLLVTCAEISIAMTYVQLTSEDHRWWWRSFSYSATSGCYVFLYSVLYYSSRLQISGFIPTLLYFGYMGIISLMFALLTGSVGFVATFLFVRAIYGSIKID
eukprot:TRINITY_DN21278_c0_g1_i1.p1 TRINITY_DN21278_c0_g1~~TRINITY_DN21278_c0_g1_i1.p1  ORF type:complete len:622 (-),score=101.65 TRINITY_DN21278_c0_g1_i1:157-2022(-)